MLDERPCGEDPAAVVVRVDHDRVGADLAAWAAYPRDGHRRVGEPVDEVGDLVLEHDDGAIECSRSQEPRDAIEVLVIGGKQDRLHLAGREALGCALHDRGEERAAQPAELVEGDDESDRAGAPAAQHARGEVRLVAQARGLAADGGRHRRVDVRRSSQDARCRSA